MKKDTRPELGAELGTTQSQRSALDAEAVLGVATRRRLASLGGWRYEPQGQWGNILGLDRLPAVKTFRNTLSEPAADGSKVQPWSTPLPAEWMEATDWPARNSPAWTMGGRPYAKS